MQNIFKKRNDTMKIQLLVAILAVLSWIRVSFSQDVLSIVASVIITVALIGVIIKKEVIRWKPYIPLRVDITFSLNPYEMVAK